MVHPSKPAQKDKKSSNKWGRGPNGRLVIIIDGCPRGPWFESRPWGNAFSFFLTFNCLFGPFIFTYEILKKRPTITVYNQCKIKAETKINEPRFESFPAKMTLYDPRLESGTRINDTKMKLSDNQKSCFHYLCLQGHDEVNVIKIGRLDLDL